MAARPDSPAPVLDLKTLVERPQIAIDGVRYDILSPEELSILDLQRFAAMGERLERLGRLAAPTPEEQAELLGLVDELAGRVMVGVPDEVREVLPVSVLGQVIRVFTQLLPAGMIPAGATPGGRQAGRSTGASRRPGSSASTAGTRAGGSPKRRSRS